MRPLANDPTSFREEMLVGLTDAFGRYLERVPGASGVARAGGARRGKVTVIVGGGAGHFPAFAGLVGSGLADGAVVGDIFTSPSAAQAERVARALDGGAGTLFSFGNYAGDVLNFGIAERRLRASGIDCRTVLVTDDVASAPVAESHLRRGIAGTLVVFKAAGAAAERGEGIDEVERLARLANAHTVTLGVGFAGCTVPGHGQPLFSVEPGKMEIGLGIHGEPGISTGDLLAARDLAGVLLQPLLEERPAGATRAAVLLNGLGSTKYEELFVVWGELARQLRENDVEVVLPEVGELVTSLDMAGCSLTCCWLDDELEELWRAPADTPGFRRPVPFVADERFPAAGFSQSEEAASTDPTVLDGADGSPGGAPLVRAALAAMLDAVAADEEELGRLDAVAGDGDHGSGMVRGLRSALAAVDEHASRASSAAALHAAGRAWGDHAGGTSGVLWGLLLEELGHALARGGSSSGEAIADALDAATASLRRLGGASPGDKTMLDALIPFTAAFRSGVATLGVAGAWAEAAAAASAAAGATASLRPRVGRARPLAERSVGTPDPGAVSLALCLTAVAGVLASREERDVTPGGTFGGSHE